MTINTTYENSSVITSTTTTTTTVDGKHEKTATSLSSTKNSHSTSTNKNEVSPSETSSEVEQPEEEEEEYDKKSQLSFFSIVSSSFLSSSSVLHKKLYIQSKKHFGGAFVNVTHSTVHIPTIIYSLSKEHNSNEIFFSCPSLSPLDKEILLTANWSYNLNQAFIDNYNQDPELTWQYFCSQTGLYRVWPGHKWEYPEGDTGELDLFDCRVQNWYIRATSSPRDVIILIDASGSMTGLKKSIAIQTVETILDTLSDDDFVQIIKVNFALSLKDLLLIGKCHLVSRNTSLCRPMFPKWTGSSYGRQSTGNFHDLHRNLISREFSSISVVRSMASSKLNK